jgi:hypothetical protein
MAVSERFRLSVFATAVVLALPSTTGPGPRLRLSIDRDVYAAIVSTLSDDGSPEHWFVPDIAIPLATLSPRVVLSLPDWALESLPAAWDDVPLALRRELTRRFPLRCVRLPRQAFPASVTIVNEAELAEMVRHDSGAVLDTLRVSRVLTAADDLDAVVYYERRCGFDCTYGAYVWLQRASPSQVWRVHTTLTP